MYLWDCQMKGKNMIEKNILTCPVCTGPLKYYDSVHRVLRAERRKTRKVKVRRLRCKDCGHIIREAPDYMLPFKQYRKDIIYGVVEGHITSDTYGYEDYPCEITMIRWKNKRDSLGR